MQEIFLFLEQTISAIHFLDLLIVIELSLWNWKKTGWHVGYVSGLVIFSRDTKMNDVRYNKLSIATGMTNASNLKKIVKLYLFYLQSMYNLPYIFFSLFLTSNCF